MIIPDYPKVWEYNVPPYVGTVSQWFLVTTSSPQMGINNIVTCKAPSVYSTDNIIGVSATSGGNNYVTGRVLNNLPTPFVNSDHVWELSNMKNFLGNIIDSSPNPVQFCNTFQNWLVGPHLNNILSYLPSKAYPDVAALDALVNSNKGKLEYYPQRTLLNRIRRFV